MAVIGYAKQAPLELDGVACQTPPPLHCADKDCPGPVVIDQGTAGEPKTGRKFFIDYPCNLKRAEKVDQYVPNLRKYRAIAMDVGLQDTLMGDNKELDRSLVRLGVSHTFET